MKITEKDGFSQALGRQIQNPQLLNQICYGMSHEQSDPFQRPVPYRPHLRGGGIPRLACPLIAREFCNKDEREVWDVLHVGTLCHMPHLMPHFDLPRAGQIKEVLKRPLKVDLKF